jgi:hypothetical protein
MNEHDGYKFIQFVSQVVPDESGCWKWGGPIGNDGYGWFQKSRAHRYSYTRFKGPIPDGLFILHSCDTPSCVCPHHLSAGTQLENMRQKMARGRHVYLRGEQVGAAKLTAEKVKAIRQRHAKGETQRALGKAYGMSQGRISMIVNRKSWTHVLD